MTLDIENFDQLREYLALRAGERELVLLEKLPGGVSNRTVKVTWSSGNAWVLKQALAKLRVKEDWFSSPERIHVEANALKLLNHLAPAGMTPDFVFEDTANHLLAMEAVSQGHENWKSQLLAGNIVHGYFEQCGFLLGCIHRRSAEASAEIRPAFADTCYFESLRLDPYYSYVALRENAAAGFLQSLVRETLSHKLSLVHGDFSPKNILVHRGKLILLDYEVVHFGDPAFDVGFVMTHFLSKANHLRNCRAGLAGAAALFWQSYSKEIAPLHWEGIELRSVRHTLACLLARVMGKSPLEYLTGEEAARQKRVVLGLLADPPSQISELIAIFVRQIEAHGEN